MKLNIILIAFSAFALLTSCEGNKQSEQKNGFEFSSLTGQKVFTLEDTAQEFGRDEDVLFRDSASLVWPEVICGKDLKELYHMVSDAQFR